LRTSMVRTNDIGERDGSPWRSPRAWQILLPGYPFRRIFVLAVDRIMDIQFRPKPMCCRTSKRKDQDTALAMSILSRMIGDPGVGGLAN
jgi:hypothetical protein